MSSQEDLETFVSRWITRRPELESHVKCHLPGVRRAFADEASGIQELAAGQQPVPEAHVGFTLIELLVVVGIITVLIAILLPALNGVRRRAQQIKCMANLHSLGQALILYSEQTRFYPGADRIDSVGQLVVWPTRLRIYLNGNRQVFRCPARGDETEWTTTIAATKGPAPARYVGYGYDPGEPVLSEDTPFSYGYDVGFTDVVAPFTGLGFHGPLRANQVRAPAEMVAIGDSPAENFEQCFIMFAYYTIQAPTGKISNLATHHFGGANVLFCDGHVQWFIPTDIQVSTRPDSLNLQHHWRSDNGTNWAPGKDPRNND